VSFATLGNGHASHVAVETLARAAGVRLLHVPFKEAGSLFTAVAKGDVDLTAFSYHSMAGLLAAGRVRPLAVAARQRLRELPDLPTLAEAGAPAVDMHPWAALVTVAGTPSAVLGRLQQDRGRGLARTGLARAGRSRGLSDHAIFTAGTAAAHRIGSSALPAAGGRRPHRALLRTVQSAPAQGCCAGGGVMARRRCATRSKIWITRTVRS
jgi:tripartite-type tricarboxylate transporter receptor subunit TctC